MPIERIQIHSRTDRFILCPGCLANADVPDANIQPMTDVAHRWGNYPG
ncbi:MAG: hypothetical protein WCH98_09085 [Verrucomicrobiota bacterium]